MTTTNAVLNAVLDFANSPLTLREINEVVQSVMIEFPAIRDFTFTLEERDGETVVVGAPYAYKEKLACDPDEFPVIVFDICDALAKQASLIEIMFTPIEKDGKQFARKRYVAGARRALEFLVPFMGHALREYQIAKIVVKNVPEDPKLVAIRSNVPNNELNEQKAFALLSRYIKANNRLAYEGLRSYRASDKSISFAPARAKVAE